MSSLAWGELAWDKSIDSGGGIVPPTYSPDVKIVGMTTGPIVVSGPASMNNLVYSVQIPKADLIGKELEMSFTFKSISSGTEASNRSIYLPIRDVGASITTNNSPTVTAVLAATPLAVWTVEAHIAFRKDGTLIGSLARWQNASFAAYTTEILAYDQPVGSIVEVGVSASMYSSVEVFTIEHGHIAIVG